MFWGPGNGLDRINPGINIFKSHDVGAEKSLSLHASTESLLDFPVQHLLDVLGLCAPDRSSRNFESDEDILLPEFRIIRPHEIDRTDFANGDPPQLDQCADEQVFNLAGNVSFKHVAFPKIRLEADREKRSDEQCRSSQNKKTDSEIMQLVAHITSRFRNCRTHGWVAFSRNHDGAPSAAIPRIFGSSIMTRSATA